MNLPPVDGTFREYTLDAHVQVTKRPFRFGATVRTLAPFLEQYQFCTVAPLYLWGGLHDRVLVDFISTYGRSVEFYHHKFNLPIFRGLTAPNGDTAWNHVLWAIERVHWEPFEQHMLSAMLTDTPKQTIYRYGAQDLAVVDPLYLERQVVYGPVLPGIPIVALGVLSNRYQAAFDVLNGPGLPELRFYVPDERCKMYAQAVFHEEDLSLLAVYKDLWNTQPEWARQ